MKKRTTVVWPQIRVIQVRDTIQLNVWLAGNVVGCHVVFGFVRFQRTLRYAWLSNLAY